MRFLRKLRLRFRSLFRRTRVEADLDIELRDYFEREIENLIASGVPSSEARCRVAGQMRAIDRIKDDCRQARRTLSLESAARDLHYGFRVLRKNPAFSTAAILTLALGIATCTTLFSVAEQLWRPVPFPHASRLVIVSEHNLKSKWSQDSVSLPDFVDWRSRFRTFDRLAAYQWPGRRNLSAGDRAERVQVARASSGFLETLGVQPEAGRSFDLRHEQPGDQTVALISHTLAVEAFGSAGGAVGHGIRLDDETYSVLGVLPSNFQLDLLTTPDVLLPLAVSRDVRRDARNLVVVGELRPGTTPRQAQADVESIAAEISAEYPATNTNFSATVVSLLSLIAPTDRAWLLLLLAFSLFVMVIACANVAVLQVMRSVARRHEFALREALGGNRLALLRQTIAENAWLGAAGAALGILLSIAGVRLLTLVPRPNSLWIRETGISFNLFAALFATALAIGAIFFFTLLPRLFSSVATAPALQSSARTTAGPATRRRITLLAGVEVCLAFISLFGAALFASSAWHMQRIPPGFNPQNVLTIQIPRSGSAYSETDVLRAYNAKLSAQLTAAPGVREFALSNSLPFLGAMQVGFARADAPPPPLGQQPSSFLRAVTPTYFHLLEIPLLKGRAFTDEDRPSGPRVAIVNQNLARHFFGSSDPVGRRLTILHAAIPEGPLEIVGVAANTKEVGLNEIPFDDIYVPVSQAPTSQLYVLAKTTDAASVGPLLRGQIQSLDATQFVAEPKPLEFYLAQQLNPPRFNFSLIAGFAGLCLLLTFVALFGTLSFAVAQQRREIGIRIALGARPENILAVVFRQVLQLAFSGLVCGFLAVWILGKLYGSRFYMVPHQHDGVLYGVGIHDPLSLSCAAAAVLAAAVAAALLPAIRAAGIDPHVALRCD